MKTILAAFLTLVVSLAIAQVPYILLDGNEQPTVGKVGSGYHFDGKSFMQLGRGRVQPPWTVCMWVQRFDDGGTAVLFADQNFGLKLAQVQVPVVGQVGLTVFGKLDYSFGVTVPFKEWHHLVFAGETNRTLLYIDGVLRSQLPIAVPLPLTQIGRRTIGAPPDWLHADLDEIAIYRRALSTNEVAQIFANGGTNNLPSRISSIKANSGRVTLQINGTPKTSVLLESSPDLVRWTTSVPLENDSGVLTVIDIAPSSRIFYRISDEP